MYHLELNGEKKDQKCGKKIGMVFSPSPEMREAQAVSLGDADGRRAGRGDGSERMGLGGLPGLGRNGR